VTVHEELDAAQGALRELQRRTRALSIHLGPTLDLRRLAEDVSRVGADLALLREAAAPAGPSNRVDLETVEDREYDRSFWADAEDEGLGAGLRRVP
jgi:hypothetical protein